MSLNSPPTMNFEEARIKKRRKGAIEHKDQNFEEMNVVPELKDELLDIFNYADQEKFRRAYPFFYKTIQRFAKKTWESL